MVPLQLRACANASDAATARFQAFQPQADGTLRLLSGGERGGGSCLEVEYGASADGTLVQTYRCQPANTAQQWTIQPNGSITSRNRAASCLGVVPPVAPTAWVVQVTCSGAADQAWEVGAAHHTLVHRASGLCLDAGSQIFPCTTPPFSGFTFCNATAPHDARVADAVVRMTRAEKVQQTSVLTASIPSLGLAPYMVWSEAEHGVGDSPGTSFVDPTPAATSFPMAIVMAQSFNATLFSAVGAVIGTEGRAFSNGGNAGTTFWAPNINVFRDPRWGRGADTPGEDPTLSSSYARGYITAFQTGDGADPNHLLASPCAKHFAGYSLELWNGTTREAFNAVIAAVDWADTYTPVFQAAVELANVSCMMCSYSAINGTPSCANAGILKTLARGEWGLDGYITSDCSALTGIGPASGHKFTNSTDETCALALQAGVDIGCDRMYQLGLPAALADGAVDPAWLDAAVGNVLRVRMRLGHFDPSASQPYTRIPPSVVCSAASVALAYSAAVQGLVLAKNTGRTLPLSPAAVPALAVIGPMGDATTSLLGGYEGVPCGGGVHSPYTSIRAHVPSAAFIVGCTVNGSDAAGIPRAVAAVSAASAVILVVGIDGTLEGETKDRTHLGFPGVQPSLISAVCAAAAARAIPCVVLTYGGGALDLTDVLASPNVSAVLIGGYPGGSGGDAAAAALFGVVAPAGKLAQTVYPASFTSAVSMFEMGMRPGPSVWPPGTNPGRTHRFYTGTPVLPFGFGLSYGDIRYALTLPSVPVSLASTRTLIAAGVAAGRSSLPLRETARVSTFVVTVSNTGSIDTDEVVAGFLVPPPQPPHSRLAQLLPRQLLFDFSRVHVRAGHGVNVTLTLSSHTLAFADDAGAWFALPGHYSVRIGPGAEWAASSGTPHAEGTLGVADA